MIRCGTANVFSAFCNWSGSFYYQPDYWCSNPLVEIYFLSFAKVWPILGAVANFSTNFMAFWIVCSSKTTMKFWLFFHLSKTVAFHVAVIMSWRFRNSVPECSNSLLITIITAASISDVYHLSSIIFMCPNVLYKVLFDYILCGHVSYSYLKSVWWYYE